MFGLGTQELIIILIVAFFIFGAKKLPEIGRDLGKGIRSFKKGLNDIEEDSKGLLSEQTDNKTKQDTTAVRDQNPLEKAVGDLPGVKEAREVKESIDKLKA
ncbi:MAG: Sec-independent protein translocase subunit TatA/TatB [Thermodesulfobacteriota bacterium]